MAPNAANRTLTLILSLSGKRLESLEAVVWSPCLRCNYRSGIQSGNPHCQAPKAAPPIGLGDTQNIGFDQRIGWLWPFPFSPLVLQLTNLRGLEVNHSGNPKNTTALNIRCGIHYNRLAAKEKKR